MISVLLIGLFILFMMIGMPVSAAIGLATILGMLAGGYDLIAIPQQMAASTQSIPLMAVPFFILAANLMNAFGITQRIFDFAQALVGSFRGGLAYVNVLSNLIFSGISGAAVANAAGLGSIQVKAMSDAGYDRAFSAALSVSASTLGPIIPPSIMMIIYAITANVSIAEMFVAGLLPGILIALTLMAQIRVMVATGQLACPPSVPFSFRVLMCAAWRGCPALVAPAIIFGGIVGGLTTPTEAGIVAVVYSVALALLYRSLTLRALAVVLRETVESTALILYIIAISSALSHVFVSEGSARALSELISWLTDDALTFLLLANILLLVIGCFIETLPALLITVPMLMPAAEMVGVDPVHFGVVVVFNLLVGIITPPMGIGLYIMMAVSGVRFGELVRASLPFLVVLVGALAVLSFWPDLTLVLPRLLLRHP
ncbi:MAG: TRAP transporter large permease [Proteobacteria bacterium]|nr:TRAP transporter large permease [Pseudomonadota bacterium]